MRKTINLSTKKLIGYSFILIIISCNEPSGNYNYEESNSNQAEVESQQINHNDVEEVNSANDVEVTDYVEQENSIEPIIETQTDNYNADNQPAYENSNNESNYENQNSTENQQ